MKLRQYLFVSVLLTTWAVAAHAVDEVPAHLRGLSDAEVNNRLTDAEQLLDSGETYADIWWYGWTGFYVIGVAYQSYEAATSNHSDARMADKIIGAVKATGGVAGQFLRPLDASDGADPLHEMPSATPEDRLRQLAEAEHRLKRIAKQSDERFSLLRHGMNVGINLVGGLIVAYGFDEPTRGWRSAGVGIAVGEVMIWTMPYWGRSQLQDYETRHNVRLPEVARVSWHLVPMTNGAAVQVRF